MGESAMEIAMLTTSHRPSDPRINLLESESLRRAGHTVRIIAERSRTSPRTLMKRVLGETDIATFNTRPGRKMPTLLGFPFRDPYSDLVEKAVEIDPDVYHCHEIWSLRAALKAKEKTGSRIVYDVHEYTPASGGWRGRVIERYEKKALPEISHIFTANSITRGRMLSMDTARTEIDTLYNCPPIGGRLDPPLRRSVERIAVEGRITSSRGSEQIKHVIEAVGADLLHIYGERYRDIPRLLTSADLSLIAYQRTPNNMLAGPPHKLFTAMKAGIPVVTTPLAETARIVREEGNGSVAGWTAPEIAKAIKNLDMRKRAEMSDSAVAAHRERYNWQEQEKKLLRGYRNLG